MRTSKVLVGSAFAIAAAMQIGMGGTASADAGESLSVAAVATDPNDGSTLMVDVVYNCTNAKHEKISVMVDEVAKDGKTEAASGFVQQDFDGKTNCTGKADQVTVKVKAGEGGKWTKGAKGDVSVAFIDEFGVKAEYPGLEFVADGRAGTDANGDCPEDDAECDEANDRNGGNGANGG
ncbi:hypothetical protein ACQPW1_40095 [Nocardia sp. CA-128927]|uniref:hypothetical protein n=1 Tax=Nocardia sp. CA-128927 TaxID=3239975 RepID=UPI003D95B553